MGLKVPRDIEVKILAAAGLSRVAGMDPYAEVPLPPSVNNLFVSRDDRRFKSQEYRDWLAVAVPLLSRLKAVAPPVEVVVDVYGSVNVGRDLDNMLKPIGDALVAADAIGNDTIRFVRGWTARMHWGSPGDPRAIVSLRTIQEAA